MSDFYARAALRLSQNPPVDAFNTAITAPVGDTLTQDERIKIGTRPAAVLVPVVDHDGAPTLLLTKRADHLRTHSGQIAFPGGKIDASDATPQAAAIREAHEETGLRPWQIGVLGYLDAYQTGTGYRVLPVVARIQPPLQLSLNVEEVDTAFEVPLDFVMNPQNYERQSREWQGRTRRFYAITYQSHYIWGATAGILHNLYERLYS